MLGLSSFDDVTGKALKKSFLSDFPKAALDSLLSDANRLDVPAGSVLYREMEFPRVGLVINGLARVFLVSSEGRQVTIDYLRPGEVVGTVLLTGGPLKVNAQAMTDISILTFNVRKIENLAKSNAKIAWELAVDAGRLLGLYIEELAINTFGSIRERTAVHLFSLGTIQERKPRNVLSLGSIRERTARHLLSWASEYQYYSGKALIVRATHQEIANAVGSVREVVARTLRQFRAEGLIKNTQEGIKIIDPEHLIDIFRNTM